MQNEFYQTSILLIYTGGTIGMIENPETGILEPFNFQHIQTHVPELKRFGFNISTIQFNPTIDSSDMEPEIWAKLVKTIVDNYNDYDGFVILHGTDTMAYTASALSFMLENLSKPVILTGSQLPIGRLRTDGKENLITSIEIAAAKENGKPIISEVCIFFQNHLMRGNRTAKINAEHFNAFRSNNYPPLARSGVHIKYEKNVIYQTISPKPLKAHYKLDSNVVILKMFPGISKETVDAILNIPGLKGVVLETYGTGNATTRDWFLESLKNAIERGIVIVNVTQCQSGGVEMQRYGTGNTLYEIGVVSGYDSTVSAAITKLMFLFGHDLTPSEVREYMQCSLIGEVTINNNYYD